MHPLFNRSDDVIQKDWVWSTNIQGSRVDLSSSVSGLGTYLADMRDS